MALVASMDSILNGSSEMKSAMARGLKFNIGRITGSWGGVRQSITLGGLNTPLFVFIPPVSNYMFQYNPLTDYVSVLSEHTSSADGQVKLATYSTSIDLSCFTMYFNGQSTVGIGYLAIGY